MVNIKILGSGCKKCEILETKVKNIAISNGLDVEIEKVTDINKMIYYGIMMTPALVINEKILSIGIIPKDEQIVKWINGE